MSVLFPKVNKPRSWDYRPIYYDEEREARKTKLARLRATRAAEEESKNAETEDASVKASAGVEGVETSASANAGAGGTMGEQKDDSKLPYVPTLHRGSFREAHDAHSKLRNDMAHKSRLGFWIALLILTLFVIYILL